MTTGRFRARKRAPYDCVASSAPLAGRNELVGIRGKEFGQRFRIAVFAGVQIPMNHFPNL